MTYQGLLTISFMSFEVVHTSESSFGRVCELRSSNESIHTISADNRHHGGGGGVMANAMRTEQVVNFGLTCWERSAFSGNKVVRPRFIW